MRIVTWNCYRGGVRSRAAELTTFAPNITVLQECAQPAEGDAPDCLWDGDCRDQGVAVLVSPGLSLVRGPKSPAVPHSVYPFIVSGPSTLHVLSVWAKDDPSY